MNQSFSLQTKEEIIQKHFKNCCKKNILSGIIKYNFILKKDNNILISLSSNLLSNYVKKYLQDFFVRLDIKDSIVKKNKYISYNLLINDQNDHFLEKLEIVKNNEIINYPEINKQHCKRAYIAGLFLNSGSINSPQTSYYHLELSFKNLDAAKYFMNLISEYEFDFKQIVRSHKIICYIKKSSLVSDFLKLMDASKSVLYFENQRIERDFINNINRLNNIDVYNYQKILKASAKQIEMIQFLSKNKLLSLLDTKTMMLANLRIENEDANLEELANLMYKKYKIKISKPGVNHLFRKIKNIYISHISVENE